MARYCLLIAEGVGLEQDQCRALYLAAPMHDIGKIAVADSIPLLKPGRLTPEERSRWSCTRRTAIAFFPTARRRSFALPRKSPSLHHERWDGTGYSERASGGEDIPLFGRIAAVADVFDALTTERPYKEACEHRRCQVLYHRRPPARTSIRHACPPS